MRIEFDLAKDQRNHVKHGLSLALAAELDCDAALMWIDDRREVRRYVQVFEEADDPDA